MKPAHLLMEELNYELRIRGIVTERKDANIKRKLLSRQLEKDKNRAALAYIDPLYNFNDEVAVIDRTLDSIRSLVEEFEGPETDSAYKRIQSRIVHITERVKRIAVPEGEADNDVTKFKNESFATCLELDVLLQDRVKREQSLMDMSGGAPAVVQPIVQNVVQTNVKPVPIHKWGVQFSGDSSESLAAFLERVDELCVSRHVDRKALYESAVELFSKDALLWYRSVKNTVHDWDSLVALLKKEFLPSDYTDQLWDAIRTRFQQRHESVHIFIAQMENLFSRLEGFVPETTKLKYIKKNMLPHYITQLALTPVNNLSDLAHFCKKIDEANAAKNRQRVNVLSVAGDFLSADNNVQSATATCQTVSGSSARGFRGNKRTFKKPPAAAITGVDVLAGSTDQKTIICWNCKQPNHRFSSCLLRRNKFCFKCGKPNVTVKDCLCSKN